MNLKFNKKQFHSEAEASSVSAKENGIIDTKIDKEEIIVYLAGDIDAFNFEKIQETVFTLLEENAPVTFIFDMNEVSYVSSAGLRMFSAINQKALETGTAYKLTNMREDIMKMFQMTGYASAFCIELKEN